MNKKVVGILINHLKNRKDLQDFVVQIAQTNDIILLIEHSDREIARKLNIKYSISELKQVTVLGFSFDFWFKFLILNRSIRNERLNYKLRKIGARNSLEYVLKKMYLTLEKTLPGLVTYDMLLRFTKNIEVPPLDELIVFSVVKQHNVIASYFNLNVPVDFYLYSWDHPIKELAFTTNYRHVYVWNEGLKEDLIAFHGINDKQVKIAGSTQLAYIHELRNSKLFNYSSSKFIYVIMTTGRKELILQELDFIERLSLSMKAYSSDLEIIVRRYPNTPEEMLQEVERRIRLCGLEFDDAFVSTEENDSRKVKYHLMRTAEAVIHMGTTVGIEAILVNNNVIFYTFNDDLFVSQRRLVRDLHMKRNHLHQHHLQKYFNGFKENIVAESVERCVDIIENRSLEKSYRSTTHGIKLLSLHDIAKNIKTFKHT
jgi:hypothetical protein